LESKDFKSIFEGRYAKLDIKEGDVVEGTVAAIRRDAVFVNIGFKSEGAIAISEFKNLEGKVGAKEGDKVKVVVEQVEDANGMIVLSKERADAYESWGRVQDIYDKEETIEGIIVNKIKGGMSVNLGGIKAFLPASQIDLKPVKILKRSKCE